MREWCTLEVNLRRRTVLSLLLILSLTACVMPAGPGMVVTVEPGAETPVSTSSPRQEQPVETEAPPVQETAAATPAPASTAQPQVTPQAEPTLGAESAQTDEDNPSGDEEKPPESEEAPFTYSVQMGTPRILANFMQPDVGCGGFDVAGQVFDEAGEPVNGLVIEVTGILDGEEITRLGMTGANQAIGPSGYVITLTDGQPEEPVRLQARVKDLDGNPLSDFASFRVSDACDENLVVLNFVPYYRVYQAFVPMIAREKPLE